MEKDTAPVSPGKQETSNPDDAFQELKNQLAVFLLSLIQAFLRTGYYTPDHPESQKAKSGLYEAFQGLFTRRDELTFLVREHSQTGKNVLIEGILPEPQPLKGMMLEGMAEMYAPRFVKFLERKDLVSLTLKNAMTEPEFISFVDLMSEPRFVDTQDAGDKERFREELRERGILNISYIFNEELLATKRNLPWRARLALTRLKKDISTIPLFLKLGAKELKEVRHEIIRDIARPIREADVVYPILLNTDLAVSEEFSEAEIDGEMVSALSPKLLLGTSRLVLKKVEEAAVDGSTPDKIPEVAELLAHFLNIREVEDAEPVLSGLFRHNLISIEELPREIQDRLRIARLTDRFLEQADTILERLHALEDPEAYRKAARSIGALIPELLGRNAYEPILKITTWIARRSEGGGPAACVAAAMLDEVVAGEIGQTLKSRFLAAGKEHMEALAPIFVQLRHRFVPHLVAILKESNDALVRRKAWEVLSQADPTAMDKTLARLTNEQTPTDTIVGIIRLLGDIDCEPWLEQVTSALRSCLAHANPLVRQEVLWALCKLTGTGCEPEYLRLLEDPDVGVQKQAILCLGRIQSRPALERFFALIKEAEKSPSEELLRIEDRLFASLGYYGNIETPDKESLEEFLLKTLDRRLDGGALTFWKKKRTPLRHNVVRAICESLRQVGTEKSCSLLEKLARQEGSPWSGTAAEVLAGIRKRSPA